MNEIIPESVGNKSEFSDPDRDDNRILRQQLLDQSIELDRLRQALLSCDELKCQSQQNERERAELLEQERKLNDLKTNFVTLASHEFRTPIGVCRQPKVDRCG